ncbi:hypothetical protein SAY87_004152 [Trapa incisa]|uniref:Uncharacterized protein n=1 Tax=Trapa incisa TaxID=236973 RepID=A0AAN7JP04_9MYRT|nr:hypothetical protein SAY87_004152 [Trapa incisa]
MMARILRHIVPDTCVSHARMFSLVNGYGGPIEAYKILEHHDDVGTVRWIDDGFRGLLPFPFNSTLGGTSAAPYFNDKSRASDEQYVVDSFLQDWLIFPLFC